MGTTQLETVPEPKYWHLKTVLSEALDSEFSVGEILPNERDLAARFGVARATLRQALEQLELEGRLQRRRGVGTTVAPPRMGVAVGTEQHSWPGTAGDAWQPADCTAAVPPAGIAGLLGTDTDTQVHTVRRSRVNDGQPVAAELLYVPETSVPGLTAPDAPSGAARARAVLRELQRLELEGQDRAVELGSARVEDARELDRLPGAPVLVVTTRFFAGGRTAAVSVATYRADTCRLTFGDPDGVVIHHGAGAPSLDTSPEPVT
ncbi:GntR family transcriptional regulator [Streptomyces ruber]|uniref:GntR family transcriptional regulator n=2 Tax=Streptomyces TaxID=1883 RepID=A0A918BN66_9ACTN|nr:GntR family transcriptional regulator [Streptomyces ruber]GGQ78746.1 GntR family transcriptional regulator [Streptomyces ruber]